MLVVNNGLYIITFHIFSLVVRPLVLIPRMRIMPNLTTWWHLAFSRLPRLFVGM